MQIDRVTAAALIAAALILGLLLLFPHVLPEKDSGPGGNNSAPARPAPLPDAQVTVPSTEETVMEIPTGFGNLRATIDPVPDILLSQPGTILIHGTTNALPGTLLRIDFIAASMHPSPMEYNPDLWFGSNATVMQGTGGDDTWSVEIRTQEFRQPDRWQVLITDAGSGRSIGSGYLNVTA